MSQQYQRFKQTFLSQHPQHNNNRLNNIYGVSQSLNRNKSNDNLHIQQQSHYPFEQIQQATFTQSIQQPYQINNNNNTNYINKKPSYLGLNQLNYQQQQQQEVDEYYGNNIGGYRQQMMRYKVNQQYPKYNTGGKATITTIQSNITKQVTKSKSYYNNNLNNQQHQQQQLDRINQQLSNLRSTNNIQNIRSYQQDKQQQLDKKQQQRQRYLHPNYFINTNTNSNYSNGSNIITNNNISNGNSNVNSQYATLRPQQQQQQQSNTIINQPSNLMNQQYGINSKQQNNYNINTRQSLTPPKQQHQQLPIIYSTSPRAQQQHYQSQLNPYNISPIISTQQPITPISTINSNNPNNSRLIIQSQPQQQQQNSLINNNNSRQHSRIIIPQIQQQNNNNISNINSISKISLSNYNNNQQQPPLPTPNIITNTQQYLPSPQQPPQLLIQSQNQQQQFIPIKQYQRLRLQCISWQQQYHQLQYQSIQLNKLKQQNLILVERIKSFQNAQKQSYQRFKLTYEGLIKKYQQSLQKQCSLLVDRCRLEMKHNDKF